MDKFGYISFNEVGLMLIGCTVVDVVYDLNGTTEITIEHEGYPPLEAKQLVIGKYSG